MTYLSQPHPGHIHTPLAAPGRGGPKPCIHQQGPTYAANTNLIPKAVKGLVPLPGRQAVLARILGPPVAWQLRVTGGRPLVQRTGADIVQPSQIASLCYLRRELTQWPVCCDHWEG